MTAPTTDEQIAEIADRLARKICLSDCRAAHCRDSEKCRTPGGGYGKKFELAKAELRPLLARIEAEQRDKAALRAELAGEDALAKKRLAQLELRNNEIARLRTELDTSNAAHRATARLLAETGRKLKAAEAEIDRLRAAAPVNQKEPTK